MFDSSVIACLEKGQLAKRLRGHLSLDLNVSVYPRPFPHHVYACEGADDAAGDMARP